MSALSVAHERCPFLAQVAAASLEPQLEIPSPPSWPSPGTQSRMATMVQFYERAGGLLRSEEVLFLLRRRSSQALSMLARWIVDQRAVTFEWQADRLVPMFQFDLADMSIRPEAAAVLAELAGVFDDVELAGWFAEPNAWLNGRTPVDALEADARAVLDAARADRFVARG
ncbi:MAG TPA: antitoxin Xre/MbcA/ParS toxin-binding domain-containing protein [Caldimonas sp.]|nr:antitoxin Xre/MbcA/ParS toxin-binding domain-containing protein [Caldimonas sp.]